MSKDRIEGFSDSVFAVALTLLVLGLTVPVITNHASFTEYTKVLSPLLPKLIAFVITFLIIAIHWIGHYYLFHHLKRISIEIVWLNIFLLLWICLMPFPTVLLGEHLTDQFPLLLMGINQLLAALTFFAIRVYATRSNLFVSTAIAKEMGPRHSVPAVILYALAILFVFVNVYLSLACFLLGPVIYFVPNLLEKRTK